MVGNTPTSFRFDPLDKAVERLWFNGIVVVAAAGNFGTAGSAVDMSYAPGNDRFVVSPENARERLANFINQELWGAVTTVPWAVRFVEPTGRYLLNGQPEMYLGPPRHPSQLYEAFLEGIVLFSILAFMFWKTKSRYEPGKLVGAFIFFYGCFRFGVEFIREPDSQLIGFARATGLHMGQWLSLPMILGGLYLMLTAAKRRVRVEATAGSASIA